MAELLKPITLNKIWGATNLVTPPSDSKISQGWTVEIPTWEDFQWLDNRQDQFIAYLNQHGMPEWDSTTEYQTNKSYIMGSNGTIYRCILTNTNVNPVTDSLTATYWVKAFDSSDYAYSKSASDTKYLVKANNLSDITSQSVARTNLGLGTAATQNTGTTAGQIMTVGSFGVGSSSTPATIPANDCNSITATGFYSGTSSTTNKPTLSGTGFTLIHITYDATNSTQFVGDLSSTNSIFGRTKVNGVWSGWGKNYNSTLVSSIINSFMGSNDAATARSILGIGTTGVLNGSAFMNTAITNWGDAGTARNGLGLGNVSTYNFSQLLSPSGYYALPGGLIIQWGGFLTTAGGTGVFNFPITFPNQCFTLVVGPSNSTVQATANGDPISTSQFRIYTFIGGSSSNAGFRWCAFGY